MFGRANGLEVPTECKAVWGAPIMGVCGDFRILNYWQSETDVHAYVAKYTEALGQLHSIDTCH